MYPLRAQRFDRKTTHPRGLSAVKNNRRQEFEVSQELRRLKRSLKTAGEGLPYCSTQLTASAIRAQEITLALEGGQ